MSSGSARRINIILYSMGQRLDKIRSLVSASLIAVRRLDGRPLLSLWVNPTLLLPDLCLSSIHM